MASIHKEVIIEACPERVWSALEDIGALHTRLAPGFVTDVKMEGDDEARLVTFGNGMTIREKMIDVDPKLRRVAWSAESGMLTHHNASAQVFAEGPNRTRFVWIADILPCSARPAIEGMIEQGLAAIRQHLESEEKRAAA
jgi:uncharacterized protein YndB with AHSA1/START domain